MLEDVVVGLPAQERLHQLELLAAHLEDQPEHWDPFDSSWPVPSVPSLSPYEGHPR